MIIQLRYQLIIGIVAFFLAIPLAVQVFPFIGWLFFACIPGIFFITYTLLSRDYLSNLLANPLVILFGLILIVYIYGIITSSEFILIEIVKNLIRGLSFFITSILLLQLLLNQTPELLKKIVDLFLKITIVVGCTGATFGLAKYWLMQFNYSIKILNDEFFTYPWGTSLQADYNFYALSLFISGLLAIGQWSNSYGMRKSFMWSFFAAVIFNAGFLTGSRRFLLLAPICLLILLLIVYKKNSKISKKIRWKQLFVGFSLATLLIHGGLHFTESDCSEPNLTCWGANKELELRVQTLVVDSFMKSRIDRWLYTFEIIEPPKLLFGSGFSYREKFGCKFNDCKIDDYPHSPILSALLYGGLIGFFSVLACFIYALVTSYQILTRHSSHADLALGLIATTVFVSISGDSLLSMPVFFSMLLISRCVVWLK